MSTLLRCTALFSAMLCSASLFAQSENQANTVFQLKPIVVTATREQTSVNDVPARISVISPEIVKQSPIAQLSDLLRSEASLNVVQLGGVGQQTSIFMRGTDSDHTLVLRDGVRLNNDASGLASLSFLDTTDIHQIEVLKGPASVLYGTNAIGGVVQVISETPKQNTAFVTTEVGEHNTYKALIGADYAQNDIFLQVRGQRLESDGTEMTDHQNAQSASYDQKGFSVKAGLAKQDYGFSLDHSENQGNSVYEGFDWLSNAYQVNSHDFKNATTTVKGYVQALDNTRVESRISRFKDELTQLKNQEKTTYTADEYELMLKQRLYTAHQLTLGVTHKNLDTQTDKAIDAFQQDLDTTGYYIQHQYKSDRLSTQLGYRIEDHEKYGTHDVAQFGARWHLQPNLSVYSNIGTAFKAPTVNDLYYGSSANPHLKPEESTSYEIGIDHDVNAHWHVGASVYHTDIKNLIDYADTAPWGLANLSKARMQGAEALVQWQKDDYFVKTSYHYVKATNEIKDSDLLRRPRQTLTLSAGVQNDVYGLNASLVAKSKAKDWDTAQSTPGYASVDLHGYWQAHPNAKLFTNIQNVADTRYKAAYDGGINGVYYINGGRLASVGVTLKY